MAEPPIYLLVNPKVFLKLADDQTVNYEKLNSIHNLRKVTSWPLARYLQT